MAVGPQLTRTLIDELMPVHRLVLLTSVALSAAALTWSPSLACGCVRVPDEVSLLEYLDASNTAIFLGSVASIRLVEHPYHDPVSYNIMFNVIVHWKGPASPTLLVETAIESSMCGYQFKLGEWYVVYARVVPSDNGYLLATGTCSRTKLLREAKDDLEVLGDPIGFVLGEVNGRGHR